MKPTEGVAIDAPAPRRDARRRRNLPIADGANVGWPLRIARMAR